MTQARHAKPASRTKRILIGAGETLAVLAVLALAAFGIGTAADATTVHHTPARAQLHRLERAIVDHETFTIDGRTYRAVQVQAPRPIPVIRYTMVQPTCHASEAGQVGVVAGNGWHMFPARCDADGPDVDGARYVWDALPMPQGTYRGDRRVCAALATLNAAGIPGARDLGRLAYRGLYARGWFRHDAGALVGALVTGRPFRGADFQLQRDCGQD